CPGQSGTSRMSERDLAVSSLTFTTVASLHAIRGDETVLTRRPHTAVLARDLRNCDTRVIPRNPACPAPSCEAHAPTSRSSRSRDVERAIWPGRHALRRGER